MPWSYLSSPLWRICRVCCLFCALGGLMGGMALAAHVPQPHDARAWLPDADDARRALPNNATPPLRRTPRTMLPPLPAAQGGIVRRVQTQERLVALTLDLCELASNTNGCDMHMFNFLRQEGLPATLFLGGKWMRTHARRLKQLLHVPHFEMANHAWTHGNCALLAPQGLRAQVLWTQAQYELLREQAEGEAQRIGQTLPPRPPVPVLFRLPYGRAHARALQDIAALGLRVIQWDVVAESDTDTSAPRQARAQARLLAAQTRPGAIVLFHANLVPRGSAELLRAYVAELRARGFAFVTVSELLRRGTPEVTLDGYFSRPGDNLQWDKRFGPSGTGERVPFTGE